MNQPVPGTLKYSDLINEIEKGRIKIPQFQRDFVWGKKNVADLIDSIIKGYPIGTFILWKTKEELRSVRNIGNLSLPMTPKGDFVQYVLDGQQRMTSIFCCIKGLCIENEDGKKDDYSEIYIDLEVDEDEAVVIIDPDFENATEGRYINVSEVYTGNLMKISQDYMMPPKNQYFERLSDYSERLKTYDFSTIAVNDVPIDIATEIFTRINVGGKSLSVFEIMVAKTFDNEKNFDLAEKYDKLIETLQNVDYDTIPSSTILQCISVCLVKECNKKAILKLEKNKFVAVWDDVEDSILHAVEYFINKYRIPVSGLLPYYGLLVPFTYCFYKNKNNKPEGLQKDYLQDFFWRTVLNSRYSNSLETKIAQDIKKIDTILKGKLPKYEQPVDISTATLSANGWFSTGKAYIKGFLCILAYMKPLSLNDNADVNISNSWLKQANSKNYHHFFPKAYLSKKGEEEFYINHIANITIVDDFLNKQKIKDKAPGTYMKEFVKINTELDKAVKSHLIIDLDEFGIWDNDYDTFFNSRLEAFAKEFKKRLVWLKNDIE